jgi:hypothetical protein
VCGRSNAGRGRVRLFPVQDGLDGQYAAHLMLVCIWAASCVATRRFVVGAQPFLSTHMAPRHRTRQVVDEASFITLRRRPRFARLEAVDDKEPYQVLLMVSICSMSRCRPDTAVGGGVIGVLAIYVCSRNSVEGSSSLSRSFPPASGTHSGRRYHQWGC